MPYPARVKPTLPLLPLLALGALVAALLIWSARPERESALAAAPAEPAVLAIDRAPPSEPAGALRQVAPNSAPTQAAPEQLELSADELTALQTDTAFGTLEVLVLDGRQPLGNARVLVHGELGGGAPEALP